MAAGRQVLVLLQMSLGSVKARLGLILVVIVGVACVVGVLISMLSMGASFRYMATKGPRPDRLIVTADSGCHGTRRWMGVGDGTDRRFVSGVTRCESSGC